MKVKLFQISPEEDRYNLLYMHYEFAMSHGGIKESSYELVFSDHPDDTLKQICEELERYKKERKLDATP